MKFNRMSIPLFLTILILTIPLIGVDLSNNKTIIDTGAITKNDRELLNTSYGGFMPYYIENGYIKTKSCIVLACLNPSELDRAKWKINDIIKNDIIFDNGKFLLSENVGKLIINESNIYSVFADYVTVYKPKDFVGYGNYLSTSDKLIIENDNSFTFVTNNSVNSFRIYKVGKTGQQIKDEIINKNLYYELSVKNPKTLTYTNYVSVISYTNNKHWLLSNDNFKTLTNESDINIVKSKMLSKYEITTIGYDDPSIQGKLYLNSSDGTLRYVTNNNTTNINIFPIDVTYETKTPNYILSDIISQINRPVNTIKYEHTNYIFVGQKIVNGYVRAFDYFSNLGSNLSREISKAFDEWIVKPIVNPIKEFFIDLGNKIQFWK